MYSLFASIVLAAAAAASIVPLDTPEVAHAKAQHLAVVEQTKLRNALAGSDHGAYSGSSGWYAPAWNQYAAPVVVAHGHVQDTPEVAHAKAKHLAILAAETARNSAPLGHYPEVYVSGAEQHQQWGPSEGYLKYGPAHIVVVDGQVQDTPEVAAAKAKHISALYEADSHSYGSY